MRSHHTIVSFENHWLYINHRLDQINLDMEPMTWFHMGDMSCICMSCQKKNGSHTKIPYLVQLKAIPRINMPFFSMLDHILFLKANFHHPQKITSYTSPLFLMALLHHEQLDCGTIQMGENSVPTIYMQNKLTQIYLVHY